MALAGQPTTVLLPASPAPLVMDAIPNCVPRLHETARAGAAASRTTSGTTASRLDMGAAPGPRFPKVFGNPHRIGAPQQWAFGTPAVRRPARWAVLLVAVFIGACSRSPTDPNVAAWRVLPGQVESFVRPGFRAGRQCWVYL